MELVYLGIVIFLFALSTFDLFVGVSNDAVNFLGSAIGSKVARFKTILIIAAVSPRPHQNALPLSLPS